MAAFARRARGAEDVGSGPQAPSRWCTSARSTRARATSWLTRSSRRATRAAGRRSRSAGESTGRRAAPRLDRAARRRDPRRAGRASRRFRARRDGGPAPRGNGGHGRVGHRRADPLRARQRDRRQPDDARPPRRRGPRRVGDRADGRGGASMGDRGLDGGPDLRRARPWRRSIPSSIRRCGRLRVEIAGAGIHGHPAATARRARGHRDGRRRFAPRALRPAPRGGRRAGRGALLVGCAGSASPRGPARTPTRDTTLRMTSRPSTTIAPGGLHVELRRGPRDDRPRRVRSSRGGRRRCGADRRLDPASGISARAADIAVSSSRLPIDVEAARAGADRAGARRIDRPRRSSSRTSSPRVSREGSSRRRRGCARR